MHRNWWFLFSIFILLTVNLACAKSNETDLRMQTGGVCNTANVSYSANISPILQDNCNFCHNTSSPLVGVNTDNYSSIKILADKGSLLGTITHATGFVPMPLGRSKLSNCDINKIRAWIAAGAPNN